MPKNIDRLQKEIHARTNREYTIDDHVGVVLAVGHKLVDSLDPLSEVL